MSKSIFSGLQIRERSVVPHLSGRFEIAKIVLHLPIEVIRSEAGIIGQGFQGHPTLVKTVRNSVGITDDHQGDVPAGYILHLVKAAGTRDRTGSGEGHHTASNGEDEAARYGEPHLVG